MNQLAAAHGRSATVGNRRKMGSDIFRRTVNDYAIRLPADSVAPR